MSSSRGKDTTSASLDSPSSPLKTITQTSPPKNDRTNYSLSSSPLAEVDFPVDPGPKVRVWKPPYKACHGQFVFPKPAEKLSNDYEVQPILMLREAAVDYRHNSLAELRSKYRLVGNFPLIRIAVQVSAVRGVSPVLPLPLMLREDTNKAFPKVTLASGSSSNLEKGEEWRAELDYIIDNPVWCSNRCFNADRKNKSHSACAGNEWQVIVTISGPSRFRTDEELEAALVELQENNDYTIRLDLSLPTKPSFIESDEIQQTKLSVSLGCVYGLSPANTISKLLPKMPPRSSCKTSEGSVLVAGSPLHGTKRQSTRRREIAHFAARALKGSIIFDTVAVGVISNYSVSEISALCRDGACRAEYHSRNDEYMNELALAVEDELSILGVPKSLWDRIALFPLCRLGTDFGGYEKNSQGCRWSAFGGQWMGNDLAYTIFSPHHRWYASFDLDEFSVNEGKFLSSNSAPHRRVGPEAAAVLFDKMDLGKNNPHPGSLQIGWIDFHLEHRPGHSSPIRNITRELMKYGGLEFADSTKPGVSDILKNRSSCWQQGAAQLGACGKAVISCRNGGFGTHVHNSLSLYSRTDLASRSCNLGRKSRFDSQIALYHGSTTGHGARFGNCKFAELP